jgi:transposase
VANALPEAPSTTVGVDLSDRFTSICILDEHGEVLEEGRIRTTPDAFDRRFSVMESCRVVLEVGTHSPWVSKCLTRHGHEVIVANPRKVQLIAASIQKTDRSDAETLARLGRADPRLLSPIVHRSTERHADLEVIQARQALIAARTLLINHIRGSVKSFGGRLPTCDAHSFFRKVSSGLPVELEPAIEPVLRVIGNLTNQITELDDRIEELSKERYPETTVLRQVPGVGPLISLTYVLTIGDPRRFTSSRQLGPYLGLVPRQRESGTRAPALRISKAGDKYLRQLLVNGAHYILGFRGPDTDLRRWGLARIGEGKAQKKRAVVAVARKLAVLLHRLWVTGEVYIPLRSEGIAA